MGLAACIWHVAGLWTTLALYYTAPAPTWLRAGLGAVLLVLFVLAWRWRRAVPRTSTSVAPRLRPSRWIIAAAVVGVAHAAHYFLVMTPTPDLDWDIDHAVMPSVQIDGRLVTVRNVRRFEWRTATDFTPGYGDAVYDLDRIESMHYALVPLSKRGALAHVFLCFGFTDGQHVAISVEARRVKGRPYRLLASMFRQYQLIYVVGDERDILGLRGVVWNDRVQLYPARTTPDQTRAIFLEMIRHADALRDAPEFYHLLTNNCMSNILRHLRRLDVQSLPGSLRLLLTGFSDRVAYDLGYLDTDLPFPQAYDAFRIDDRIRRHHRDDDFSLLIRRTGHE